MEGTDEYTAGTYYNIKCIQAEMSQNLVSGICECITNLDELSRQYSYIPGMSSNIHLYNGWKTNKAWYINRKVIIPLKAFHWLDGSFYPTQYDVYGKLADMEKALDYLDGGLAECKDMFRLLDHAKETGQTKKIRLKYFEVTFYKKGTCHIEFLNEDLLKKLNIFGSRQKGWLPPGYGKKTYQELNPEEKETVDSFEGEESYRKAVAKAGYFIYDPASSIKMLGVAA